MILSVKMKRFSYLCSFYCVLFVITGCFGKDEVILDGLLRRGYASGTVKDAAGKPLKGVKIIVDNGIFFNSNITSLTDDNGTYRIKIPHGSWYVFAQYQVTYNDKTYSLYLHPDNSAGMDGEGGIRNFEWRLTGQRPEPLYGDYGGIVTIDNFPGIYINHKEIDFTFTPVTPLIDGSTGKTLHLRSSDGYTIKNIPIGRYLVTATYHGMPVRLRSWGSDDPFKESFLMNFEPEIPVQCDNCAMLEFFVEN